jgi:hypothetical protein
VRLVKGLLLKPTLNLLNWVLKHQGRNSLILGGPLGWSWEATLDAAHHGSLVGPADAHRHSDLANISIDDHHARDHATRHAVGGGDQISLDASQIGSGRFGKTRLEWTANKLLLGAGTGADPTEIDPPYGVMDFWSDPQEEVQLGATAGTKTLPTVTVANLPSGATIVRAVAMFKFRMIENTNASANKLNGATVANTSQVIQVADDTPGTYYDAINFVDDQFGLAATTREGGDVLIGSIDIAGSGKVDANDGYLFRWLLARADLDNLNFNDVQCGLRIWYSA